MHYLHFLIKKKTWVNNNRISARFLLFLGKKKGRVLRMNDNPTFSMGTPDSPGPPALGPPAKASAQSRDLRWSLLA